MNCYSEWDKIKQGVPQGSVLGPLLFLLYINDLPKSVNDISSPILFADDTNLICTQKNFYKYNDELVFQKINRWLQANLLTLNFNKTNLIQFTSKNIENTQAHIKYRGNYIQNTNKTTFLVLTVDKTISWQSHLDKLSSKLSSASYILRTPKTNTYNKKFESNLLFVSPLHQLIWFNFFRQLQPQ